MLKVETAEDFKNSIGVVATPQSSHGTLQRCGVATTLNSSFEICLVVFLSLVLPQLFTQCANATCSSTPVFSFSVV